MGDAEFDQEVLVELALSAGSAVVWWYDFASDGVAWLSGLDDMLGLSGSDEPVVRARLADLIAPLTVAAKAAAVWQTFELEQECKTPANEVRWILFRARVSEHDGKRTLLGVASDVTSQRLQQQALTDLADRYRLLIELSPDAIVVHEAGHVVYANPAAVRFVHARSDAEILGRPITDFVHADSVPQMLQRISELNAPGAASEPAEAVLLRFDGGTIDIESVSVRTTWEGRPAFQVIMRDVTAAKAAAAAVHYQAALVAHVSDALIATTANGVVTSWNPSAEQVYGYSSAEAIGRPIHRVVGASLDPSSVLEGGGVVQTVHSRSDGSALAVRVSVARMDDGYVLICADETARRRAEQHFTTVVAAIEEGVIVIGPSGLVESVNPAAERILGIHEEIAVGTPITAAAFFDETGALVPPSNYPSVHTRLTGQPQHGRIVRVDRPGKASIWLSVSSRALTPGSLPSAVVVSFTDITERRMIDGRLEHEATHDALTGLFNRTVTIDRLSPSARGHRSGHTAVLFIDLDKFKVINDSLGHSVGDEVLKVIGTRLTRSVRRGDVVGRLGGDEFVVVAYGIISKAEATALADHIRAELNRPIELEGRNLHVDASIGIVIAAPEDTRGGADLLRDADLAMYEAKTRGRGRHAFFDVDLRERTQRRLQLEQDLREAPRTGQLWLAYQPIADLRTGEINTVEGLLRWTHPSYGPISPSEFIPLAEESDLINIVGAHMLYAASAEIVSLRSTTKPDLQLTVNLSARQLDDPFLVPAVRNVLRTTGLPPSAVCLEITESALMREPKLAARTLAALRDLGARLAIDDFGTGYSSLAQLLTLPLDTLKIDRTFVSGLGSSEDAEAIVTSIIAMAHAVDLTVVAEGVEDTVQLDILRQLNCDQAQGFLVGRPMPSSELF
ncbi:GGDEF domain-containing protein [Lentzea sp. NBRC 105346]|nr:EAL domain-containing protein [Lentzea sp. NBRC 105346]GLZ29130.1 GGDEF domain-containing protein [Lentzea sp. NBRC 105346]